MTTRKTVLDYIADEDYSRFEELTNKGMEAYNEYKRTHKTVRAPKTPLTKEQLVDKQTKKIAELQAKLDALLAMPD